MNARQVEAAKIPAPPPLYDGPTVEPDSPQRSLPPAKTPDEGSPPYYLVRIGDAEYEAWDVAVALIEPLKLSLSAAHPLCIAVEYLARAGRKKPDTLVKDLKKARNCIVRAIEVLER